MSDDQRQQLDRLAALLRQHSAERAALFWDTIMSPRVDDDSIRKGARPHSR